MTINTEINANIALLNLSKEYPISQNDIDVSTDDKKAIDIFKDAGKNDVIFI